MHQQRNMFEDNQTTLIRKINGTKFTVTRDRENVTGIDGVIFTVQTIRRLRNMWIWKLHKLANLRK